ncbi:protein of unknown function DUF159 [Beutenbergia cavernae DSM 12333]|uniref:Abasic site processing protein n=1 Tax=Beutenbergia cavernae (strain ATCC BAA-8 / DSM 12333 / CCUG 43141 / JCM 11478 / NBRC 16432 / NCIMB 13614 / HKI 0122) TaxID=471853 RepID=C5BYG5_BEUC1|nr:SOS response-associated peptidase [Beutenbergia cavernae]ACQ81065.1 protein of unknown function DUF159 [Beutenbergia cavernae DSM 12333]
MCGRYAQFRAAQELADAFDVDEIMDDAEELEPSWNVAPTDGVRTILDRAPKPPEGADDGGSSGAAGGGTDRTREMHLARWGLVPGWAKDLKVGSRMFNARLESLAEKPAFAKSLATRRCLVPADGYFEWQKHEAAGGGKPTKTPFFIHSTDGAPLAFAGLYAFWRDRSKADDDPARWVLSTTVVTTQARDGLEAIHDREPAVLAPDVVEAWLDPALTDPAEVLALLETPPPPLEWYEVSARVGSVRNNGPELVDPV